MLRNDYVVSSNVLFDARRLRENRSGSSDNIDCLLTPIDVFPLMVTGSCQSVFKFNFLSVP